MAPALFLAFGLIGLWLLFTGRIEAVWKAITGAVAAK